MPSPALTNILSTALLISFVTTGRAEPPPQLSQPPATMDLICWQNGVKVVDEREISRYPRLTGGIDLRKSDGSSVVLFGDQYIHGLCLLRLPKDLPKDAFAY